MSQPDPGQVPVLDTRLRGKELRADPRSITFGRKSMALDEVEWVSYWGSQIATKRFMAPTTHRSEWHFEMGKYPYRLGPTLIVLDDVSGRPEEPSESWTFLVSLAKRYLEPRLLADLVERVRQGETVTVGGSVKVSQEGIACDRPKVSVPWKSVTRRTQLYKGTVWVYQKGVEDPVLTVPQSHPNAALIPALFAAFMS